MASDRFSNANRGIPGSLRWRVAPMLGLPVTVALGGWPDRSSMNLQRNGWACLVLAAFLSSNAHLTPAFASDDVTPIAVLAGHTDNILALAFSPDDRMVLSGGIDGMAKLWNSSTGAIISSVAAHSKEVMALGFSSDRKYFVTASADRSVKLWKVDGAAPIATLGGFGDGVTAVAFSPDNLSIAASSYHDRSTRLWDVTTGKLIHILSNSDRVRDTAFSPDGRRIATASFKIAHVWDAASGQLLTTLKGHSNWINRLAVSRDGARLVTASEDRTARIWNLGDPAAGSHVLSGHSSGVRDAAFSPDGSRVATASLDGTVRIWDVATGRSIAILGTESRGVGRVFFSADSRLLVGGGFDSLANVWCVANGIKISVFRMPGTDPARGGRFSVLAAATSGQRIALASGKQIALWDLAPTLLASVCPP